MTKLTKNVEDASESYLSVHIYIYTFVTKYSLSAAKTAGGDNVKY